jgi:hypothetical protein
VRLSPITKYSPFGIFWVLIGGSVMVPGGSHGSGRSLPLMHTWTPQDEITWPGSPITRFTRSFTFGPALVSSAGLRKTMMSPVCTGWKS